MYGAELWLELRPGKPARATTVRNRSWQPNFFIDLLCPFVLTFDAFVAMRGNLPFNAGTNFDPRIGIKRTLE
jgi:hypothetical protein